jgi:hypothetical protein
MIKESKCKHPPNRLFSWFATDATGKYLCVACCDCGEAYTMEYPFHKIRPSRHLIKDVRQTLK